MLDKCRATIAGTNGEYHYACPLDQRFLTFLDVDPEALKAQVAEGKGDGELLAWIHANAKNHPTEFAIDAWSNFAESRVPADIGSRAFFNEIHKGAGASREDIATWFDVLDLDDYASFGGKA